MHTASAEHDVATAPTEGADRRKYDSLTILSSTLQSESEPSSEDVFQGKACLLWARWVGLERKSTTAGFDITNAVQELGSRDISVWTRICIVKSAYIEGTNYMRNGRPSEAQKTFSVAITYIQTSRDLVYSTQQLAYWSEQLLAQAAMGAYKQAEGGRLDQPGVDAFKSWAAIAMRMPEISPSTFRNSDAHVSRLPVWQKFYECSSASLRTLPPSSNATDSSARMRSAAELRRVERGYENELLGTLKFPTATETNEIVEQWVEQAALNWQALCGPQWHDAELGEGGRDAISRNMLDILYRAATKTFHSTLVLRRLFQVHKSLSEFDLAYRAFDTYIELVERGRTRVAKSKEPEAGHESDKIVLTTVAEAITGLCNFGGQPEARKGYELCLKLEDWLITVGVEADDQDDFNGVTQNGHVMTESSSLGVDASTLEIVYRAIGCGKAHWARWTPVSEKRSELQGEALMNLRKACSQGSPTMETLYATSLLLAETREISEAIECAKRALTKTTNESHSPTWVHERKVISLWHLLALLLSSRQDYDSAMKSCIAASEQFIPNEVPIHPARGSSIISPSMEKQIDGILADVGVEFDFAESQRMIEVRITELALTELADGPEEAVNNSNELLSLFSQLFASVDIPIETPVVKRSPVVPRSSASTIKSTRHSIFGRKRQSGVTDSAKEKAGERASTATDTTRPNTQATQAPTIQVTHEDEKPVGKGHLFRLSHDSSHSKTSIDGGSRRVGHRLSHRGHKDGHQDLSQTQTTERPTEVHASNLETVPDDKELPTPIIPINHANSPQSKQELPEVSHNLGSHTSVPPPASHGEQPPQQDVHLPTLNAFTNTTSPTPRFPKAVAQRHGLVLLTKVWLVIATLYRRASMFEDSREACDEAAKSAAKVETLVGTTDQSARAYAEAGWGAGTKSADEVFADVYCERAELLLAIYNHKIREGQAVGNEDLRLAIEQYEQCLMFTPNHPLGMIGLSNVLLDYFEKKIDIGKRVNDGKSYLNDQDDLANNAIDRPTPATNPSTSSALPTIGFLKLSHHNHHPVPPTQPTAAAKMEEDLRKTPENLDRLAARDRAYGLLSTLTKLGSGWDNSEAWYALARAHELGGEIEKARDILWWCIELEDTKPIRHWRNLGYGI